MIEIERDITTIEGPAIILHGVNCQGKMGSGVAKALYTKWPIIKKSYEFYCNIFTYKLGSIDIIPVDEDKLVINCFTQEYYGYDGKVYADLKSIKDCFLRALKFTYINNIDFKIYFPRIGCGLGGLKWEDVKPMLEEIEQTYKKAQFIVCNIKENLTNKFDKNKCGHTNYEGKYKFSIGDKVRCTSESNQHLLGDMRYLIFTVEEVHKNRILVSCPGIDSALLRNHLFDDSNFEHAEISLN